MGTSFWMIRAKTDKKSSIQSKNQRLTLPFYETFSNSIKIWSTFKKENFDSMLTNWETFVKEDFDLMLSLKSDEMTDFLTKWRLNYHFLLDILKKHAKLNNFCKRSFWIQCLVQKVMKWLFCDHMTAEELNTCRSKWLCFLIHSIEFIARAVIEKKGRKGVTMAWS